MSWTELMPGGPGTPPALRELILAGLAIAALDCRDTGTSDDCGSEPCPACQKALTMAGEFDAAYMQVAAGSTAWCDLAVKLISEMN